MRCFLAPYVQYFPYSISQFYVDYQILAMENVLKSQIPVHLNLESM